MVNPFEETLQAGKVSDDYNIGNFGEFDRFEDERNLFPEMFERPQSTIGGYDEQGYTLPASKPDSWFWGYSGPGDIVEQERGVYPFLKRHTPEWAKDIYRGAKGGWEGTSLNPNINPRGMNQGLSGITNTSKIDLNEIFRMYPGINMWRLIQNLDARGIDYAANDRGIGSLDEYQMAELTEDQMDLMRPGLNQPDLPGGLTKEQLWNKVKENEYEGWGGILGFGSKPPQEDTTREEYDDYYKRLLEGEINPDTGKSYWVT